MANVKESVMEGDFCEVKKWFVIPFLVTLIFFLGADLNKADAASVSQLESVSKKYLGVKYKYGGTSVSTGFDCSGYTQKVFKDLGITIPRTTGSQMSKGTSVSKANLKPGDLVFFNTSGKGVSHVGIYIGNNQFIHSATGGVQVTSLNNSYWKTRYMSAKRVTNFDTGQAKKTTNTASKNTILQTTANLNLRAGQSTKHKIVTTIPKGKQVTVVSKSGSWYKVKYGSKTGFVSSSYVKTISKSSTTATKPATTTKKTTATKKTTNLKTTANLNLRTGQSTKHKIVTTIPKGKQVTLVSKSGSWYKVKYGSKTGYVSASYVKTA